MSRRLVLWMARLFAIGSVCFALGSFPPYFNNVAPQVTASTFFVGSLFLAAAVLTATSEG